MSINCDVGFSNYDSLYQQIGGRQENFKYIMYNVYTVGVPRQTK